MISAEQLREAREACAKAAGTDGSPQRERMHRLGKGLAEALNAEGGASMFELVVLFDGIMGSRQKNCPCGKCEPSDYVVLLAAKHGMPVVMVETQPTAAAPEEVH
jgi:hypothetical protein